MDSTQETVNNPSSSGDHITMEDEHGQATIAIPVDSVSQIELGDEHYVTLVQNGQTYAIPFASYESMQSEALILPNENLETLPVYQVPEKVSYNTKAVENTPNTYNMTNSLSNVNKPQVGDESNTYGYMASGQQNHIKSKYKIVPNLSQIQKKKKEQESRFRPIKVDNWGIFLLNSLQNYFKRKDLCDLVLRFPEKNLEMKTHKLILCSCSEMFADQEKNGKLSDGYFDMPPSIQPAAMQQILTFMYSGKLEVSVDNYESLLTAAKLLGMAVLAKMIAAQKANPVVSPEKKSKRSRKEDLSLDPIQEAKKFKRIDMKVKEEELMMDRTEKIKSLEKLKKEQEEMDKLKLPGKRLPVWLKREEDQDDQTVLENAAMLKFIETEPEISIHSVPSNERQSERIAIEKNILEKKSERVINTYQKRKPCDKPKIPRKLREMHEHLMFEKILKTGSKNTLFMKSDQNVDSLVLEEDIKDLGKEHRERAKMMELQDEAYSDCLDNSEYILGNNDASIVDDPQTINIADGESIDLPTKTDDNTNVEHQEKQVFEESIEIGINNAPDTDPKTVQDVENVMPNASSVNLDDALEDFAKEVEEDSDFLQGDNNPKPGRGRPPKSVQNTNYDSSTKNDVFKNQEKIIQDLLKKNPNLLKSKKPIQLKIVMVDKGKKTTQTLTIKPVSSDSSTENSPKNTTGMIKSIPKVCFSGKKGRPRQLRPGEKDPHAYERNEIKEKLKKDYPSLAKLVESGENDLNEIERFSDEERESFVKPEETKSLPPSDLQPNKHITGTYPIDVDYNSFHSDNTSMKQYNTPVNRTVVTVQSNEEDATFASTSTPTSYIDIHHIPVSVQGLRQHHPGANSTSEMIQLHSSVNVVANQMTSKNILANQQTSGNIVANQQTSGNIVANQQISGNIVANQLPHGNIVANQLTHGAEVVQMMDANNEGGKFLYVMDLKSMGNLDASSNTIVLPYLPVVTPNAMQQGIHVGNQENIQHINFDSSSLIPVSIGGVTGVLPTGRHSEISSVVGSSNHQLLQTTSSQSPVFLTQGSTSTTTSQSPVFLTQGSTSTTTSQSPVFITQGSTSTTLPTIYTTSNPSVVGSHQNHPAGLSLVHSNNSNRIVRQSTQQFSHQQEHVYIQQQEDTAAASTLTGRTIQINVPLPQPVPIPVPVTAAHHKKQENEVTQTVDQEKRPVVHRIEQDWDSD